ncbi:MAG: D-aminoacyl-tRNA deacylase [Chitinivibrionales bacterium]|nr:D-aminoacyl-tRNA deacylase [Chitinivibrionales bacterium]
MKIVLQRVAWARVRVNGAACGEIGMGLLLLLGIHKNDNQKCADTLAQKCGQLRIFSDESGKMNLSLADIQGAALVVSQFTLIGDCRKGRRPSFTDAADPVFANKLYEYFVGKLKEIIPDVQTGVFGAMMEVELLNAGPVTLILEDK